MSGEKFKVVCGGHLKKSPTSGGRGRWKLRWVELVQSEKDGRLSLNYYSNEKKRNKHPIGEWNPQKC